MQIIASQYAHILKHENQTSVEKLINIIRSFSTAKYIGISKGNRDGVKIRFLSEDSRGTAELLITVYGKKNDILFEKTAYEPNITVQETLKIWREKGIDVGEVATSSGVAKQNRGTGAKPPLNGPTSNNIMPLSTKKSSGNSKKIQKSHLSPRLR